MINLASGLNAKENMHLSQNQVWLLLGIMLTKGKTKIVTFYVLLNYLLADDIDTLYFSLIFIFLEFQN